MRKRSVNRVQATAFLIFLALTFLLFPVCTQRAAAQSSPVGETVYVTATGARYHLDGCSSLRVTQIAVSLTDAIRAGYEACSICRPPVPSSQSLATSPQSTDTQELYRVNVAGLVNSAAADIGRMTKADVVGHVDGDTVRVRISNPPAGLNLVETIRLLGVDTPETVHPDRDVEFFGQEASDFTKEHLLGKTVFLAFDWDLRDRYGRLLAYIYTEDGRCFNALLVQEGYSPAYTTYPFQFMDEFKDHEQYARLNRLGLWAY